MSCYEWERGTITLPSASVAPLKKHIRDTLNAYNKKVFDEAVQIHKVLPKSTSQYEQAMWKHQEARAPKTAGYAACERLPQYVQDAYRLLTYRFWNQKQAGRTTVTQPTAKELPTYTNRDNRFFTDRFGGAELSFDGRTITWDVEENNHAVDDARDSVLGRALFTALDKMQWTRGTGGEIVGNNEYNRDDDSSGGGANYVSSAYGPLGKKAYT